MNGWLTLVKQADRAMTFDELREAGWLIRCIDDEASEEVIRWTPEDGRPDRVGQYRDVDGMRIDPPQVGDAQVFRTWGWSIALIVSEDIKLALERIRATGVRFTPV